jgi:hypothetical protein
VIQYPIARAEDGSVVHIRSWQPGQIVACFGCDCELIGRLPHNGIAPTAHFAHKADTACDGEGALHKAAKEAIVRAHTSRVLSTLSWLCPRCSQLLHRTDLSQLTLHKEKVPCEGVVTDVLGLDGDGRAVVAIEVVVTHDIEPQTMDRYLALGTAVFVWRPAWNEIAAITEGSSTLGLEARHVQIDHCAGCEDRLRKKLEWLEREEQRKIAEAKLREEKQRVWEVEQRRLEEAAEARRETACLQAEKMRLYWEDRAREQRACAQREEDLRKIAAWWDPWIAAWRQIGEECAHPGMRSIFLDLIAARCAQLEIAREQRLDAAIAWAGVYPICRSCGHRMASRDHRCAP